MADALLIGLSALDAQRRAMEVTSHNIANASTEGYSRQVVSLTTPTPEETKPGTVGRGVRMDSIRRQVDNLVNERYRKTFSDIGRFDTLKTTLADLELVYNEPGEGGLSAVVDATFGALEDLSNNPESVALRTGVVQQLETFSSTIRQMQARLTDMRDDLKIQMDAEIQDVNRIIGEVADLNQSIKRLTLVNQNPNDLMDQRDNLLRELSERMQIRVFTDPRDQTVRVELQGSTLVSNSQAFELKRGSDSAGNDTVLFAKSGARAQPVSGSLGAAEELSAEILPAALDDLNDLTSTLIRQFNSVNAVGISHTYSSSLHASSTRIDTKYLDDDLDDQVQSLQPNSDTGIHEDFLPVFTDANGNQIARNLTINVYDETSETAEKFTVRYDPGVGLPTPGRSLEDLVQAINTGVGGGFTVYPPRLGGVEGVSARAVAVSDGISFQLNAGEGYSIDFSPALDLRPADDGWTGSDIGVSGTDAALADGRMSFEVQNGGTELLVFRHDPTTGERVGYPGAAPSVVDLTDVAGSAVVGGLTINYDPTTATGVYRDGDGFSASFDNTGTVSHTESATWTDGNAGFTVSGRYTGEQTFAPGRRWGAQVLRDGVVGASSDITGPDGPPIVSFSYWDGPAGAGQLQTVQVTLDERYQAGDQFRIADGVYAVFDEGRLTAGDNAAFTVDAEPDQAGLLAALGINNLFDGNDANDIQVAEELAADPGRLAVSKTRSAGDNSNLLDLIAVRQSQIYGPSNASFNEFYQAQVSDAAVRTQQNDALLKNQELVQQSLQNRRDQISGVSIDEEVGLLIRQQQAYGAAARVISVAKENVDTLLRLVGG